MLSACLLTGATAAVAQPLSCASVAPEVRERVREAGACRDDTPGAAAPKAAASAPSATITMKLSDGTVVRIPREISTTSTTGASARRPTRLHRRRVCHERAPPHLRAAVRGRRLPHRKSSRCRI